MSAFSADVKGFNNVKNIFLSISILLHLLAFLQFNRNWEVYALPVEWITDFNILLSLSASFTLLQHFFRFRKQALLVFSIIRVILFLIIGIPFNSFLDVEYLLLFAILIDTGYYTKYPLNLILSFSILLLSSILQFPMSIYYEQRSMPTFLDIGTYAGLGLLITALTCIVRKLFDDAIVNRSMATGMNGLIDRLLGVNKDYLEYATQIKTESTKNERTRIIQELHDIVGKAFTNIYAMMDASIKHPPSEQEEQSEIFTWVREQARQALDETRNVLYRIREFKESELRGHEAILNLINTFKQATGVSIDISWGNLPNNIVPETDLIIYKAIQESLVNSFRHGNASHIQLVFWVTYDNLLLTIRDNGTGGSTKPKGIGQSTMEKRLNKLGGSVVFEHSRAGYGVFIKIPAERVYANEKTENTYNR